ncbi:MAG: polysaccharide deacetylase family protein [Lentisphaeria bacterium]|nr:polysaccharide deacetylase family protein [Lentisphaeria bacterium]
MVKVACCWDDGVVNDIKLISLLKKYNAKATFNLCTGLMPEQTDVPRWLGKGELRWTFKGFINGYVGLKDLKEVYGDFQVASHGWTHKVGTAPADEFIKDALDARHYLEDVFQRECLGYAWPCGAYTPESAKLLKDAGFLYGRTIENTEHVGVTDTPMRLNSSCHFQAWDFMHKFQAVKERGGIFYFWGHSYELLECEDLWKQFENKLDMLSSDPEVEWIDVIDIVR